jgi:hypothetical protein
MMTSHISAELVRRCELRHMGTATTEACTALGMAVDAGIVSLSEVLDLVRSCSTADELGDALCMLAAAITTATAVPSGRVFRILGERETVGT